MYNVSGCCILECCCNGCMYNVSGCCILQCCCNGCMYNEEAVAYCSAAVMVVCIMKRLLHIVVLL